VNMSSLRSSPGTSPLSSMPLTVRALQAQSSFALPGRDEGRVNRPSAAVSSNSAGKPRPKRLVSIEFVIGRCLKPQAGCARQRDTNSLGSVQRHQSSRYNRRALEGSAPS
jgi:hypothetical protein